MKLLNWLMTDLNAYEWLFYACRWLVLRLRVNAKATVIGLLHFLVY